MQRMCFEKQKHFCKLQVDAIGIRYVCQFPSRIVSKIPTGSYLRSMRRTYRDHPLKYLVREAISQSGLAVKYQNMDVTAAYRAVVGEAIWKRTKSVHLLNGHLVVKIESAPVKQEFMFQRTRVMELLNEKLGSEEVQSIEIR